MLAQPQLPAGCWGGALPAPSPIARGLNAKPSSDADLVGQGLLSEAAASCICFFFSLIFTAWNSRCRLGLDVPPSCRGWLEAFALQCHPEAAFPWPRKCPQLGPQLPALGFYFCARHSAMGSTFGILSSSSWKSETPQKAPQTHGAAPRGGRSASPRVPVGPRSSPSCPISLLTTAPTSPAAAPSPPRP